MKKTYKNPEIMVVKIASHQMLASSIELDINSGSVSEWAAREDDYDWEDE